MIPVIAGSGTSFRGAFDYYLHDKGARTTARVAWTQTLNMLTDCAEKAWKVMAYTAKSQERLKEAAGRPATGRKLEKPVFAYSLSWHPEQKPSKDTMVSAAKQSLDALGLRDYETVIAAHQDEPQPHVHVIVNRVHPRTGVAAPLSHSKRKLSDFAREWEQKEGKVYCMLREENHRKRQKKQSTKYADPVITAAWAGSLDSKGFRALLEAKGYELAQGRKRMVVVDPQGKTHNPVRHLPGIRASAFEQRMSDLDPENLPTPEAIVRQRNSDDQKQKSHQAQYEERAADAINNLRSRQHEEWSEVSGRHDRIIRLKVRELSAHYSLEEHQNQIHSLQVKLSTPGRLRKLANKYLRWDRITTARVESLQATQNNARQRFDEVIDHLKQERLKALQTLEHSHNRDGEELAARLEKWKPEDRRLKQSRLGSDREHEHGREQNKDRPRLNR